MSPCWLSPFPCLITSPSCWGTHFLYLSNPPSGNLLPILPWCKSYYQKTNPFPVFPPLISVLQGNLCLLLNLSTKKEQYVIHDVQFQIQIQKINLVDNTAFKQTKMYIYFILVYFLWIKTIYLMLESKYWLSSAENVKSSSLPHLFNSICLEKDLLY